MRLEWLEDMVAIFESDSLNEAASRRYLTQPAFSRRVRSIEEYLGVELIDRSRKPARPTTTLIEEEDRLRAIAQELRSLIIDLRKTERQASSRIVIASQHAITTSLLPQLIAEKFSNLGVKIRLRSANRSECTGMLITKEADITMTYRSKPELARPSEEYIEETTLSEERLLPVGSAALLPLLQRGELPMVGYPSDVFLGKLMETDIYPDLHDRFRIEVKVETALTVAAMQIAAAGVGIAWIPKSMLDNLPAPDALVQYTDILPGAMIATTAARLIGRKSKTEEVIWAALSSDL